MFKEKQFPLSATIASVAFLSAALCFQTLPAAEPTTAAGHPAEGKIDLHLGEPGLELQQVFRDERFPNVVGAVDGTIVCTFGSSSVRARRSEDGGKTWGDEIIIANPGFQCGGLTVDEKSGDIIAFD